MKTIKLTVLISLFVLSCSSDDGNENECQEIRNKYNKLIELAEGDDGQQKILIRNRDRSLEINGCI